MIKSPNVLNIGLSQKLLKFDVSFQPAAFSISLNDSPLIFALLVEVDLVECD